MNGAAARASEESMAGSSEEESGTAGSDLAARLVTLENPHPEREYEVICETPELTCVCPVTGAPDFATITISYVPASLIIELKSLKLYLWGYRDQGAYHEDVTNRVLNDLVSALSPRRMTVMTDWFVRGGIHPIVKARHP
jgi:7-cyano-7-deazaguanine reductase